MSDIAVHIENLSKSYQISHLKSGQNIARYKTLQDEILRFPRRILSGLRGMGAEDRETVWALKDVSFDVYQGDVVGIIGRNGAGKSTLLKILSRITDPTGGRADIYGKVGSLLEVGTGFHQELTGRENIFLNGAILGMRRHEIISRFDEIVAFAEVEKYIDTPVKFYSSGMYVRLAFAVAANLVPEILIVDEVLAVGDAQFQKKCLGKMGEVASQGRTVLFVSHNMSSIAQLCNRGVLLNSGQVVTMGPVGNVVDAYLKTVSEENIREVVFPERSDSAASFTRFSMTNARGEQTRIFSNSEGFTFEIEYVVNQTLSDDHIFLLIDRVDGLLILKAADDDYGQTIDPVREPGRYKTKIRFPGNILNEGLYQFRVVFGKRHGVQYEERAGFSFEIEDWNDYTNSSFGKRNGTLLMPLVWSEININAEFGEVTD